LITGSSAAISNRVANALAPSASISLGEISASPC
jgi:hypothetical protein